MKIFCNLKAVPVFKNSVVALGVFDGMHLAHRRILQEAVKIAKSIRGRSLVITFWPHPQQQNSLYSLDHRLRLIAEQGLDACLVISFNREFSALSAKDFIRKVIVEKIAARYVLVGNNFRFGAGAKGDCKLLKKLSEIYNFKLKVFSLIKSQHLPVSSTLIRKLVSSGKLLAAEKLLLRPVTILGTVVRGASLARRMGFPTANINPHHEIIPPEGIYAVKVVFGKKILSGICYIGKKRTFEPENKRETIEVHIFNFNKQIYGKDLEVRFIKKVRDDKIFVSKTALAEQIKKDIFLVKKSFLATN